MKNLINAIISFIMYVLAFFSKRKDIQEVDSLKKEIYDIDKELKKPVKDLASLDEEIDYWRKK
jgi:hypothetical protein